MYFSRFASKVILLVRGESLTKSMSQYLIDQIDATENIEVWTHSSVVEVKGESHLEALKIENAQTGAVNILPAKSLFIFIGAVSRTDWLEGLVQRDERGFVMTGADMLRRGETLDHAPGWSLERDPYLLETSVPGIFAVGDVRHGSIKRVASGVGEGSICVQFIHRYLSNL